MKSKNVTLCTSPSRGIGAVTSWVMRTSASEEAVRAEGPRYWTMTGAVRKALLMVAKADLAPVLKYKPDPVYIPAANVTWSTAQRFIASYPTTFLHGVRCGSDCTGIFETGTHCDLNLNVELQVELERRTSS